MHEKCNGREAPPEVYLTSDHWTPPTQQPLSAAPEPAATRGRHGVPGREGGAAQIAGSMWTLGPRWAAGLLSRSALRGSARTQPGTLRPARSIALGGRRSLRARTAVACAPRQAVSTRWPPPGPRAGAQTRTPATLCARAPPARLPRKRRRGRRAERGAGPGAVQTERRRPHGPVWPVLWPSPRLARLL